MRRNPNESFTDYQERRKNETLETKDKLRGTVLKVINSEGIPRLKRQFNRISKKFELAGPVKRARLLKTAKKIEKKLNSK